MGDGGGDPQQNVAYMFLMKLNVSPSQLFLNQYKKNICGHSSTSQHKGKCDRKSEWTERAAFID